MGSTGLCTKAPRENYTPLTNVIRRAASFISHEAHCGQALREVGKLSGPSFAILLPDVVFPCYVPNIRKLGAHTNAAWQEFTLLVSSFSSQLQKAFVRLDNVTVLAAPMNGLNTWVCLEKKGPPQNAWFSLNHPFGGVPQKSKPTYPVPFWSATHVSPLKVPNRAPKMLDNPTGLAKAVQTSTAGKTQIWTEGFWLATIPFFRPVNWCN